MNYSGPERREAPTVEVIAERLDNHLQACELQNKTVLEEIRELRMAVQPVIDAHTTAKGVAVIAKFIAGVAAAVVAIASAVRWIKGGG